MLRFYNRSVVLYVNKLASGDILIHRFYAESFLP